MFKASSLKIMSILPILVNLGQIVYLSFLEIIVIERILTSH